MLALVGVLEIPETSVDKNENHDARMVKTPLADGPKPTGHKTGWSLDQPVVSGDARNPVQTLLCLCLRKMRQVLMPNGSKSIAPATTVAGSGTDVTAEDEMLPE